MQLFYSGDWADLIAESVGEGKYFDIRSHLVSACTQIYMDQSWLSSVMQINSPYGKQKTQNALTEILSQNPLATVWQ